MLIEGMSRSGTVLTKNIDILIFAGLSLSVDLMDVVSGTDVILKCRFDPGLHLKRATLYWIRSNRRNHDNVAIGETAFHQDYR